MANSTIFLNFSRPIENKDLNEIFSEIQNGRYKKEIENIRYYLRIGDAKIADRLKRHLQAFTPSATFKGGRKADLLDQYSGFVHLDFDNLTPEQFNSTFQVVVQIPFTFGCFRSPSGKGLKVFIEVNTGAEQHETAYKQVQAYYETALGVLCDSKCKDITRLCYVSYDPDTFINNDSQKFEVKSTSNEVSEKLEMEVIPNNQVLFEESIRLTEKIEQYHQGNRNNFVYLLACNCNRQGLSEHITLTYIITNFDLSENEVRASVKSAYNHHSNEFANFAKSAKALHDRTLNHQQQEPTDEDYLKNTPTISNEIYNQLPDLIKSGSMAFADIRERDVFLTGAFSILSGCLPYVKGVYARQTVYPNLFSFVVAPAASGKGALKFSKTLADKYHDQLIKSSKENQQRYTTEMNEYKTRQRSNKKDEPTEEPPEQPPFKVVFIPANSSYAKVLTHLEQNLGEGIICETEADTMNNVLKKEWGGYSDLLRKAFHHERVSSSKRANNEYIEVNEPRISVALSGTPNQVTGLIANAEDGMFSRFIFYAFKVEQEWHDVSPKAWNINLTDHFQRLSQKVNELVLFLTNYPTTFDLSEKQWEALNASFTKTLKDVTTFTADEAGSIVKRLGLILYRIAMILTTIRKFENNDTSINVICNDTDYNIATQLADIYLQHSLFIFNNLPNHDTAMIFKPYDNKQKFYKALPQTFKRSEAVELGKKFNLASRSVDTLLKELRGKFLNEPQYGMYSKETLT